MKRNIYLPLTLLCIFISCNYQGEKISPNANIKNLTDIISKCEIEFQNSNFNKCKHLADSAIQSVETIDSLGVLPELAMLYNQRGNANRVLGENILAWNDFQKSLTITTGKKDLKRITFQSYLGLSVLFYYYQEGHKIALDYINQALNYSSAIQDSSKVYYLMCESYITSCDEVKAKYYLEAFIKQISYDTLNKKFLTPDSNKFEQMEPWVWEDMAKVKLLEIANSKEKCIDRNKEIAFNFNYSLYHNRGYEKPSQYNLYQLAGVLLYKGDFLLSDNFQVDSSFQCLNESYALSTNIGALFLRMKAANSISKIYSENNNIDSAYKYLQISESISKKLYNNQLNTLKLNNERENNELKLYNEKKAKRNLLIVLLLLISILIFCIVLLIRNAKQRKIMKSGQTKLSSAILDLENNNDQLKLLQKELEIKIKNLEEQHKIRNLLTTQSQDGIFLIQEDKFKFTNESFQQITEYSEEELNEMHYLQIVHPDSKVIVKAVVDSKFSGKNPAPFKYKILTKSDCERIVMSFSELCVIEGKPSIYGYLRDVTKEENRERELTERIAERTEELNEALDNQKTLLDKVIHEIDAPTAAIRGKAEILKSKLYDANVLNPNRRQKLDDIIGFCNILFRLSGNVTLSKNDIIQSTFTTDYPSLEYDLLQNAIYVTNYHLNNNHLPHNITISLDTGPIQLKVVRDHFQQVFFNILSNAVKFSLPDATKFKIEISSNSESTGVNLFFSDWGLGIQQNEAKIIFEERKRGSNSVNKLGMGLGLYVSKRILDAYGCDITLSHYNSPTTFKIFIPNSLIIKNKF